MLYYYHYYYYYYLFIYLFYLKFVCLALYCFSVFELVYKIKAL